MKTIFTFLMAVISVHLFAQTPDPFQAEDFLNHDYHLTESLNGHLLIDTTVLDSIIVIKNNNGILETEMKEHNSYDEEGRLIYHTKANRNNPDQKLSVYYANDISFPEPNKRVVYILASVVEDQPLDTLQRITFTYGDHPHYDEYLRERYNFDEGTWSNNLKIVSDENTDSIWNIDYYIWDVNSNEYNYTQRLETVFMEYGGEIATFYNYDNSSMELTPAIRYERQYYPDGSDKLIEEYRWNNNDEEWIIQRQKKAIKGEPNIHDYSVNYVRIGGSWRLTDSTLFNLDNELRIVTDTVYDYDLNTSTPILDHIGKFEYDDEDRLIFFQNFNRDNGIEILNFNRRLYYSKIGGTVSTQEVASFPYQLIFENPTKAIRIRLEDAPNDRSFPVQLIDQHGRRIDSHQMNNGEEYTIGNKQLSNGLYILQLKDEDQMYHWKIVVQP